MRIATMASLLMLFVSVGEGTALAQAEAAPEKKAFSWKDGFKPLVLGDKEGPASMRIGMAIQGMYQINWTDMYNSDPAKKTGVGTNGASFRRIRFFLSGHLLTPDFTWQLHLSTLPGSLEILDFYGDYGFTDRFSLRAGLTKIPFTRYRLNGFRSLSMVDWGIVTYYFGTERQLGILSHNGMGKKDGVEYEVGIFTGEYSRPNHAAGLASIFGENLPNYFDLTAPFAVTRIHPEIAFHLAYNFGGFQHDPEADVHGGPPRFSVGLSGSWDMRPDVAQDLAVALSPEIWFKAYGFALQGTGYVSFYERDSKLSDMILALTGVVAKASYTIRKRVEIAFQYALVDVQKDLRADAKARAAAIIAAETDPDAQAALTDKYKNAGKMMRKQELVFATTVFLAGQSLKWTTEIAYVWTTNATSGTFDGHHNGEKGDVRVRSQIQLVF